MCASICLVVELVRSAGIDARAMASVDENRIRILWNVVQRLFRRRRLEGGGRAGHQSLTDCSAARPRALLPNLAAILSMQDAYGASSGKLRPRDPLNFSSASF